MFVCVNVPTPNHAYSAITITIVLLDYDRGSMCVCPATVPVRKVDEDEG